MTRKPICAIRPGISRNSAAVFTVESPAGIDRGRPGFSSRDVPRDISPSLGTESLRWRVTDGRNSRVLAYTTAPRYRRVFIYVFARRGTFLRGVYRCGAASWSDKAEHIPSALNARNRRRDRDRKRTAGPSSAEAPGAFFRFQNVATFVSILPSLSSIFRLAYFLT